uniref:hypothetical protein n=1 Tax=Nonomuraea sp. CA-251285 TaxID=3240002 RepID=UPI003F49376D
MIRLPDDGWTKTSEESRRRLRHRQAWPDMLEVLVQILEVLSIQVAERKLRKPISVDRPEFLNKPAGDGVKHAVHVLRSTRGRVHRR